MDFYGDDQEKQSGRYPLKCPFCHRVFSFIPDNVRVFECGWCHNRVSVVFPGFVDRLLCSMRLAPLEESLKENRTNLYVSMEMFFFAILYLCLCEYMQHCGTDNIAFTCVFFPAIPLFIGFVYHYAYTGGERALMRDPVPVIRPQDESA